MNIEFYLIPFVLSSIFYFLIQKIFIKKNLFDEFNDRSSHETSATKTGGISIFITLLLISLYFYFNNVEIFDFSLFIPLGIMFIVGVYDDLYNANFKLKFLMQIIVAKILIDQGYVITNYFGLFGLEKIPWLLSNITTVFVFLIIVNSINFIDGIDGLAITESIKTIFLIEFFSQKFTSLSVLGFSIIVLLLPLYYFNFKNKLKVFLGDGGSLLLGTLISIYIFTVLGENYIFTPKLKINKTLFSILIIIYPLVDLLRVFIIRIKNKTSPFEPDKNHIHHLVLKKKKTSIKSLIFIQVISILVFTLLFFLFKI